MGWPRLSATKTFTVMRFGLVGSSNPAALARSIPISSTAAAAEVSRKRSIDAPEDEPTAERWNCINLLAEPAKPLPYQAFPFVKTASRRLKMQSCSRLPLITHKLRENPEFAGQFRRFYAIFGNLNLVTLASTNHPQGRCG